MPIVKGTYTLWQNCNDQTEFATITVAQLNNVCTNAMKRFGPDKLQCFQSKALNPSPAGTTAPEAVVPTEQSLTQID
eukprot:15282902-Ditylum_brightwellii.AAC.1